MLRLESITTLDCQKLRIILEEMKNQCSPKVLEESGKGYYKYTALRKLRNKV